MSVHRQGPKDSGEALCEDAGTNFVQGWSKPGMGMARLLALVAWKLRRWSAEAMFLNFAARFRWLILLVLTIPPAEGQSTVCRTDYYGMPGRPRALAEAPIIAVGTVRTVEPVGEPQPAARLPRFPLRVQVIRFDLEVLLKGDIPPGRMKFCHFASASHDPLPTHQSAFQAAAGQRYLFFLAAENGAYRAVTDAEVVAIPLYAGAPPPDFRVPSEEQLWQDPSLLSRAIAQLALQPRDGAEPDRMIQGLPELFVLAGQFGHLRPFFEAVRRLATGPSADAWACLHLNRWFPGQSACIAGLLRNKGLPSQQLSALEEGFRQAQAHDQSVVAMLEEGDFPRLAPGPLRDTVTGNREMLEILLEGSNPALRAASCAALRRHFPGAAPACNDR